MADIKGNNKQVYDYLSSAGVQGIGNNADEFQKFMEKDDNRRQIYDYLKTSNAQGLGNSYEEFSSFVYDGGKNEAKPQPVQATEPVRSESQKRTDRFNAMVRRREEANGHVPGEEDEATEAWAKSMIENRTMAGRERRKQERDAELLQMLEDRKANEARKKTEAREQKAFEAAEGLEMFNEMRRKKGDKNVGEIAGINEEQPEKLGENVEGMSAEELDQLKHSMGIEKSFTDEYEKRKAEYAEHMKEYASVRGDARNVDFSKYEEEREWLKKNEARYNDMKGRLDNVQSKLLEMTSPELGKENDEAIDSIQDALKGQSTNNAIRYGSGGFASYANDMSASEVANYSYADEISHMTKQVLNQGSKYDKGYEGNGLEQAYTAVSQFLGGALNEVDMGTLTMGLSEGAALVQARNVGEKYNAIITDTIKDLGYSDRDVTRIMGDLEKKTKELEPVAQELESSRAEIEVMQSTLDEMIANGADESKIRAYAKELNKQINAYNKKIKDSESLFADYKKTRDQYDEVTSAVEAAIQGGISPGEEALLSAIQRYTKAKYLRSEDVSKAAAAGAGFENTLEYMLGFLITGGLEKAGTKAATKLTMRHIENRLGKSVGKDLIEQGMKKLMASGPIKAGLGYKALTDVGVAAARTAALPTRYIQTLGEQMAEFSDVDKFGRLQFDRSKANAAWNSLYQDFVDNWSEGFGTYLSAGEQKLFRWATGNAPKVAIGKTLQNYRGSIGNYLDNAKFDGQLNEMLEEVGGSLLNSLGGWLSSAYNKITGSEGPGIGDKDAITDFFKGEQLATTFLSFLPLSAIGAATNISAYNRMARRYDESVAKLNPLIESKALDADKLEKIANEISGMTPERAAKRIIELGEETREKNHGQLPEDFAPAVMGYIEGKYAMDLRHDEWENSKEKMDVVQAYASAYEQPDLRNAWDSRQAEQETRAAAVEAGFTDEVLDRDAYVLAQDAASIRETEPERSQVLSNYANAKSARAGLVDSYREAGRKAEEEFDAAVRQNLSRDGIVIAAQVQENGQPKTVYITTNGVKINNDGTVSTPTGVDGPILYRDSATGEQKKVMASQLSGAEIFETDNFIREANEADAEVRARAFEAAENTVSMTGRVRSISANIGNNVVVRRNGVYTPVKIERMTNGGLGVVISGDKKALQGIAAAMGMQVPAGQYLEAPVAQFYNLLSKEQDGSLTTFNEEQGQAQAPAQGAQGAPAQAAEEVPEVEIKPNDKFTVNYKGAPRQVDVDQANDTEVWFSYTDENGNQNTGFMTPYEFRESIVPEGAPVQEAAPAAAQAPAPAPAQTAFPVDEKGNRIYDDPSVSPQAAYDELYNGVEAGSRNEANRNKFVAAKAAKAAKDVEDAKNRIAGLQARKDAVDQWELPDNEELDAFENRKAEEKKKFDDEIAQIEAGIPELERKAAHWNGVQTMASSNRDARLVARADAWTNRTGIKVKICRTIDEVDDATAKRELKKGERVMGWYNENTGEVGLYLPNLPNESEVDKTFIHEVIAHRGLRELLDKDGKTGNYDALCDKVWDQLMSEEDRKKFLAYNSHLNGDEQFLRRAAADEWIARYSETLGLEENKNLFDKFVEFVKEFLDRILGEDAKISKDDIAMLLRSSLARYESERKADTRAQLYREGIAAETQAAQLDDNAIRFNIKTEESVEQKIRDFAKTKEGQKLGWTDDQIESIIGETADLMRAIHAAVSGDKYYDEWAEKVPTIKVDWRDGEEKPTVTWSRANIEYKYDMSADLLCINNEGLETVLASPTMVELMLKMNQTTKEGFTSDDYLRLYETLRDMGFVVPCKGCFDAAMRLKMLPSVARKFVDLVNKTIDERNENPEEFDRKVRAMVKNGGETTVEGFPVATGNKADAVRVGVAGDKLTEHISWAQLMSAEGQTQALADWGGIFRAWQKTGAGRPKDKLLPEPWSGDIVNSTTTIIGKHGEKTPSYRDIEVNQGTGLRRNSHSEFRPLLAIDEIQFMREAFIRGLTVFKYMKELDDVRLFGKLGVKFNMSFFPAFVEGAPAAGLDTNGNYIAAEESVGGREYEYVGEDGKTHYDGMKGWQEAQKYINKDVSLSSVIFSIPHLIKAFTDVPTKSNPVGMWGSLIPFHASGATAGSLKKQGLGDARALGLGHGFEEAMTDYDKGVTNFEAVQNDRFGEGWEILEGTKAGTKVTPGHKLEFANGTHYYNAGLGLHLFSSKYIFDSELNEHPGEFVSVKAYADKYGHPYSIDYNDKVREIGTDTAYQDASDYYVYLLRNLGLVPRFDFEVPEETFLQMCAAANVDPNHPKLGWKGEGHSWSPVDSEAYYSLWCDYGMIDPETGKLAPHNPVGIIDAEGNRTFQLPENTIDIIKDGVARYSARKDREAERELDAIEEFARRSVAEGKLRQEDADAILSEARAEQEEPDAAEDGSWTHFRKLEDPAKIEELENGEWEEDAYRAVQFVPDPNGEWEYDLGDGKGVQKGNVYPPMSAQTDKGEWRNPIQKGVIEESEEAPGKALLKNGKWVFRLHKGNGKYVDAAYNPYIHSSDTMLNDQFSEAQNRGNLVVMRVAVPKSELDGDNLYQAEKAKDHVGRHDWKAGPIQGELTGTRTVYLSRYDKPMELMPIEKVGESVAKMLEGQVETMPTNVVWPQLRAELEKQGMKFVETDNKGKLVSGENAGKTWKQVYGKKKPAKKKSTKKQKNSDTGTRFRKANQTQNGFVSNAEAALDRIKMDKATPEQWAKMLEKEGGLKAGEDKWLGLSDWLKSRDKKSITKQEIEDYIAEHRIQIEEVKYSESGENDKDAMEQKHPGFWNAYSIDTNWRGETGVDQIQDVAIAVDLYNRDHEDKIVPYDTGRDGRPVLTEEDYDKLMDYGDEMLNELRHINPTRLNYTTDGLDNKREIALTVPTIESWNERDKIHFGDAGGGRAVAWIRFGETIAPNKEGEKIVHDHVAAVDASESFEDSMKEKYGAEWEDKLSDEEKAVRDRLQKEADAAFAKTRDYRDDKVLVIDEIQSKRHQEGREKGYVSADLDRLQKELDALRDEYNEYTEYIEKKYGEESELDKVATPEELQKAKDYHAREKELRERVVEEKRKGSIPVAPFEKNWHELAMKRMLRLAAEEGYDYVAWTTGDQQAERYNLANVIHGIRVYPNADGTFFIQTESADGTEQQSFDNVPKEKLQDYIGKELAVRVANGENKTYDNYRKSDVQVFRGLDLKVGGEGMKGFYDDILPRFMNKYGKKWGVKVSDITLPNVEEAGRVMHAVPVTQDMKDSVMEGQTMFRKSTVTPEQDKEYMDAVNSGDMEKAEQMVRDAFKAAFPNTKVVDENGNPKVMYHGTHYGVFNEFETGNEKYPVGAYFTENKAGATQYMKDRAEDAKYNDPDYDESISRVYEVFLNIERPLMFNTKGPMDESARGIYKSDIRELNDWDGAVRDLVAAGYDGAINNTDDEMTVAFFPNQIKSAEPVVRDDNGNVVPLSERFNEENNDIRFRRAAPMTEEQKQERRIEGAGRMATVQAFGTMPAVIKSGVNGISRDRMPDGHKTDKGYYDPDDNNVYVCMDNVADERDAVATVIHETVGYKGLQELLGDRFNDMMTGVYAALDNAGRTWVNAYIARNGLRPGDAAVVRGMEEYMARTAERDGGDALENVNEVLSKIVGDLFGVADFEFTDRELAYILRASYEHSVNPGWLDTPVGRAKDTLMKRELGINETDPNKPTDPDGGTRFRKSSTGTAAEQYKQDLGLWYNKMITENQNADLPVKIGMQRAMQEVFGDKWEEKMRALPESQDYLMRHNVASSRAATEYFEYMLFHYEPMTEKVKEIEKLIAGEGAKRKALLDAYQRVRDYMYAVSGLERNEWERANGGEQKDWSGITSLMGYKDKDQWQQAEADARNMIDEFRKDLMNAVRKDGQTEAEAYADADAMLNELWALVQSCTDYSLDHAYKYGLLTRDEYERLRGTASKPRMWNYYLPLRGFNEKTAEDIFGYASLSGNGGGEVVEHAKGRWTEADNPLANILNIAQREIVNGNENWARQALLNFTVNLGKNSLLSERNPWYVKDDATGKWKLAYPEPEVDPTTNEQTGTQSIEEFEAAMKAKQAKGEARQGRRGLKIDQIMANKGHRNQHLIHVKIGGSDRMIWVNGDPAMAKAISGYGRRERGEIEKAVRDASRVLSNLFTTYSLDFTAKNLIRDTTYAITALHMKEDKAYRHRFAKNWIKNFGYGAFAFPMIKLAAEWDSGKLQQKQNPTEREKAFMEFMRDGGQTGYTVVRSVEKLKKDLEKTMAPRLPKRIVDWAKVDINGVEVPILGIFSWGVRTLNEAFELLTRFTTYQTSRDMGRTGQRAAYDAKEISVNFNRRGAQTGEGLWGQLASYLGATHYFYNAGVQGFDNFLRLYKTAPVKMSATSAALLGMGLLMPFINSMLAGIGSGGDDGGDDEWYWNLPEWVRRNNIIIGWKSTKKDEDGKKRVVGASYFALPLPVEFRAIYGLGDIAASAFAYQKMPNRTFGRVAGDILSTTAAILPFNPIENYTAGGNVADAAIRAVAPDILMPFVDVATNRDYTGRALMKENPFTHVVPKNQGAYASTPKALVDACQWIGETAGLDLAPGVVRDVLNNYAGGYYRFAEDMAKQLYTDIDHPRRWDDIPFLSGFTGHIDEDRTNTYVNGVLNEYKRVSQKTVLRMNLFNSSDDITEKIAYETPELLPDKAKIQRILSGKSYELGKMYYFGMKDKGTGEYHKVEKIHKSGKSAGKRYSVKEEIKIPGVETLKKRWKDAREYWATLPKGSPEAAAAYKDVTNAWHEYYNAQANLAEKLMNYEYGK